MDEIDDNIIMNIYVPPAKENLTNKCKNKSEKLKNKNNASENKLSPTKSDNNTKNSFKPRKQLDLDYDSKVKDVDVFLKSKPEKFKSVFSDLKFSSIKLLNPVISNVLSKMSIIKATEIQSIAIPEIMNGRDVLIKSATGSGKTLSYLIPMINDLEAIKPPIHRDSGLLCLILSPTRELSTQTEDVIEKLIHPFPRIVSNCFVAGIKAKLQKRALRKGVNIIVATPNRLIYHLENSKNLEFDKLRWLIIDEADKMLELGFGNNVKTILEIISKRKSLDSIKTILLSATLNEDVEKISSLALSNPFHAFVEEENENNKKSIALPSSLHHHLIICPIKLRLVALLSFLMLKCRLGNNTGKVVVFMATQDIVEFHYQLFIELFKNDEKLNEIFPLKSEKHLLENVSNIAIYQLHGGMEHKKREEVFNEFCKCSEGFLLTTDVSSRGLDMSGINWVVQYNPPSSAENYVHRVGRTARAGNRGKALMFLDSGEVNFVGYLKEELGAEFSMEKISLRSLLERALVQKNNTRKYQTPDEKIFVTNKILEDLVHRNDVLLILARAAFQSFIRSYTVLNKEVRVFFSNKDLHLGHVAKSMAIRESPSEISKNRNGNFSEMVVDKRKKMEKLTRKRKKSDDDNEPTMMSMKKKKMDVAYRNMLAEYGL